MPDYIIVKKVDLGPQNFPTGNTRHYYGDEDVPAPARLLIVQFPDDQGYYLLYLDRNDEELTDTYHETLEKAMEQAEWEFTVKASQWDPPSSAER